MDSGEESILRNRKEVTKEEPEHKTCEPQADTNNTHHIGNVVQMMRPLVITCPISAFFVNSFRHQHKDPVTPATVTVSVVILFIICLSAVSFALLSLVQRRKYSILRGIICFASTFISFYTLMYFLNEAKKAWNVQFLGILVNLFLSINYAVTSTVITFKGGPFRLQQIFSLSKSCFVAILATLVINTSILWGMLIIIPIWDLFAVLSSNGPLNILLKEGLDPQVENAMGSAVSYTSGPYKEKVKKNLNESEEGIGLVIEEITIDDGVQLGLGDVIVLNVVVCLAVKSSLGLFTVLATFTSVLVGMAITASLSLLCDGDPVPALPAGTLLALLTMAVLKYSPMSQIYKQQIII